MDLTYLHDPAFWITQCIITAAFMFSRLPLEFINWRIDRVVRHAAFSLEDLVEQSDPDTARPLLRHARELEGDFREAPRLLRPFFAYMFVRAVKRARSAFENGGPGGSSQGPQESDGSAAQSSPDESTTASSAFVETAGAQAATVVGTVSPAPDMPSVPAPARRSRARTSAWVNSLCTRLTSLAGMIVGGDIGVEYLTEMARDLADVKKPVFKLSYSISNLIGAVKLRLILRTGPFIRTLLTAPVHQAPGLALAAIDLIMASSAICGSLAGLADVLALLGIGAWLGKSIALWIATPLIATSCVAISRLRSRWQRVRAERQPRQEATEHEET